MKPICFTVIGVPLPKGSAKALPLVRKFPKTVYTVGELLRCVAITSTTTNLKPWQRAIGQAAKLALAGVALELAGAVAIQAVFYLPRPKAIKAKQVPHITRPDIDKLARAVLDAITAVVWRDDCQVTDLVARKRYAAPGESPRVDVRIELATLNLPLFTDERTELDAHRLSSHSEPVRGATAVTAW